jgi:hypothetical protein
MCRVLLKNVNNKEQDSLGDVSTLADPIIVAH